MRKEKAFAISILFIMLSCVQKERINNKIIELDTLYDTYGYSMCIARKVNNKNYGLTEYYTDDIALRKTVFINDTPIVNIIQGEENNYAGLTYFYFIDTNIFPVGSLIVELPDYKKNPSLSNYFEVYLEDTIIYKDALEIEIIGHLYDYEFDSMTILIGDINTKYEFIEEPVLFTSDSSVLEFEYMDYELGWNFITGQLRYYKDNEEVTYLKRFTKGDSIPYIFFAQFYVEE
jgi:hypothetical protein